MLKTMPRRVPPRAGSGFLSSAVQTERQAGMLAAHVDPNSGTVKARSYSVHLFPSARKRLPS